MGHAHCRCHPLHPCPGFIYIQEASIHKKKCLLPFLYVLEDGGWEEKGGMQQQRSSPWLTVLIRSRAAALPSLSADPARALGLPIPTPRQREGLHCSLDINLNYSGALGNHLPPPAQSPWGLSQGLGYINEQPLTHRSSSPSAANCPEQFHCQREDIHIPLNELARAR